MRGYCNVLQLSVATEDHKGASRDRQGTVGPSGWKSPVISTGQAEAIGG
jgi:hypothetical protein